MSAAAPQVTRAIRPSTWQVFREEYPFPLVRPACIRHASAAAPLASSNRSSSQPECQVLRSSKPTDWPEPSWQLTKFTHGYLVPLARGKVE